MNNYYARLENNIVKEVKIFDDVSVIGDEWKYIDFTKQKMPVSIGYTYIEEHDVYISNKPFDTWTLNSNFMWEAPVRYPDTSENTDSYNWDEATLSWKIYTPSTIE